MNENLTDIIIVLDRSGSMSTIRDDVENGLNEFIRKQKLEPGYARVTFVKFDDKIETEFIRMNLTSVEKLTLEPRNMTALYDAVGKTINEVGDRLSKLHEFERPGKVIFVIVTDGYNNASKEFTRQKVADMIAHQRDKYSWQFVFIGADIDAYEEGGAIGVYANSSLSAAKNSIGTKCAFESLSNKMSNYRGMSASLYCSNVQAGNFFDEDDVKAQEEAKVV